MFELAKGLNHRESSVKANPPAVYMNFHTTILLLTCQSFV